MATSHGHKHGAPGADRALIQRDDGPAKTESPKPARLALIQMPGTIAHMPSIQLATLDAHLRGNGLSCDRFEFNVHFAHKIIPTLYAHLVNTDHFLVEWLFTRHYFGNETGDWLDGFEGKRPRLDLPDLTHEDRIVAGLKEAALAFIDDCFHEHDWGAYDIIGFSLTTQQLGASIALARLIKRAHPHIHIVFGGSMCADSAGAAIMRFCPYVDVVVRVEGELVFTTLVHTLMEGGVSDGLDDIPGLCYRAGTGEIVSTRAPDLLQPGRERPFLNYDSYFQALADLQLDDDLDPMMAIESSRGCWWGEISQCSFCGLHEIMTYRSRPADFVLAEMEHLAERHRRRRFFAVDLIAPKNFFKSFFPEIRKRGHDWNVFYEVKASMRREEFEIYAKSGGKIVQPGIESLNPASLQRMHKGVHVLQNIQFLKWCTEFGVTVYWNYLVRLPGEDVNDYAGAEERIRLIQHFMPPAQVRDVAVVRFAPYHKTPDAYGIKTLRVHRHYHDILPIDSGDLEDLAFYFEAEMKEQQEDTEAAIRGLNGAVETWRAAFRRGAILEAVPNEDKGLVIADTRFGASPRYHQLSPVEASLYDLLDQPVLDYRLADLWRKTDPKAAAGMTQSRVTQMLDRFAQAGLIMREDKQVIALAVMRRERNPQSKAQSRSAGDAVMRPRKTRFFAEQ